jgi:peptidoglycan biosynthesis protein MviN/MurJ (putative lipid II flippase)
MGRASLLLAVSLLATSLLAAAQAYALLVICGTDPRTEAFLAAYALYLPVAVMGASLRASVSSLVARAPVSERAGHASEIVSRCILFGGLVAGTMLLLAPLLAPAISGDLPARVRDTTLVALALLLPAAFLHVVAAALSGALGAHRQFGFSALAYVVSGTVSLVVSIAMLSAIGPVGAGVGVLTGTLLLSGVHLRRSRALGIRVRLRPGALRERAQWQVSAEVLSGAALGFALQANLAISLAALGAQAGAITAYSYAFFMSTMILSLSSLPLALVTLPGLVDAVQREGRAAVAGHLVRFAPYAYAVVLPLAAGFLGFGRPIVAWAFKPFVGAAVAQLLFEVGRALVLMTIPATLFYLASAASLPAATPRGRLLIAGVTIALHGGAVAIVSGDPRAVAWAHAAAMALSTIVLLAQVLRREALRAAVLALRSVAPVAVASSPVLLIGLAVGSAAPAATIAAAGLAVMIYVLTLHRLAPAVVEPFFALLRRSATT